MALEGPSNDGKTLYHNLSRGVPFRDIVSTPNLREWLVGVTLKRISKLTKIKNPGNLEKVKFVITHGWHTFKLKLADFWTEKKNCIETEICKGPVIKR